MKGEADDVRQAIADAHAKLEAADSISQNRPSGDWVDCECRLFWSPDAAHQHLMFCARHAPHAAQFLEEMRNNPVPADVKRVSIAQMVKQPPSEQGK